MPRDLENHPVMRLHLPRQDKCMKYHSYLANSTNDVLIYACYNGKQIWIQWDDLSWPEIQNSPPDNDERYYRSKDAEHLFDQGLLCQK